jgi:hypothetical protein
MDTNTSIYKYVHIYTYMDIICGVVHG